MRVMRVARAFRLVRLLKMARFDAPRIAMTTCTFLAYERTSHLKHAESF